MIINFDSIEGSLDQYILTLKEINKELDFNAITKAYYFAWNAHEGQLRKSGDPYICHPVAVSIICAEQNMDSTTIVATLLHDVLEDTNVTHEIMVEEFGETVTTLVDGVTKITALQLTDNQDSKVETYRKIILTTAKDIRVIIIKFADRIHNLRTLSFMTDDKKQLIATETIEIYAPLAQRLGMRNIKTELEDLAFKYLYPNKYDEVVDQTSRGEHLREELIETFRKPLIERLNKENIFAEIFGRSKHYYSIYKKNISRKVPFDEIYDLLAIRVICISREECYRILGVVHSIWTPIPDKLKDYVASPKSNGYQSIHTTVAGPNGNFIEIQIRTWQMHYIAEEGVAAHWRYKMGSSSKLKDNSAVKWLRNLVEWQKEFSDSVEFYEFFKIDISHNEITVQTPKLEKMLLPIGSTVLDFAFYIHTDIGLHCIGAKVNGQIEKPGKRLNDGDTVEILHSFDKKPSTEWLKEAVTPKARFAIKRWLKKIEKTDRVAMGRKLFYQSFNRLHLPHPFSHYLQKILNKYSIPSEDTLFDKISIAVIDLKEVVSYVESLEEQKYTVSKLVGSITKNNPKVVVDGMDGVMTRYATCCHPLPGDAIIGFLTKGRGISVHRKDCPNAKLFTADKTRTVRLSWGDENRPSDLKSEISIISKDRKGLIKEITEVIERHKLNISAFLFTTEGSRAEAIITVELNTLLQLKDLKKSLRRVDGVTKVSRKAIESSK